MGEIFKKYINKGKIGIYSELPYHEYNIVQEKLIEMFSDDKQIEFIKCTFRAQDMEYETEAVKQISFYHVRESMHSGIQETYNQLKNRIYYPKLLELVQVVINQCDLCKEIKYDRKPIKNKFKKTETPSNKNQVIHIDTYVVKNTHFLTTIDKFSKFAAAYSLNDRNHMTIVEQLEEHFTKIGKPDKIIADNEFNSIRIKELLMQEGIELHLTKPNSHTGNSDIEKLHNSLAEKFRVTLKTETSNMSIKQIMQKAVRNYNDRYHSTIKCTPNEAQNNKVELTKIKENIEIAKKKMLEKNNSNRENYEEKRKEGFIKNYRAVRHKEAPKYKKAKLKNIDPKNIKRAYKFTEDANDDNINSDNNEDNTRNVDDPANT